MRSEVLRHLLPPLAAGCVGGIMAVSGLILSNVGSLRELMLHSHSGWLAALLLYMEFAMTFGAAAVGLAASWRETAGERG